MTVLLIRFGMYNLPVKNIWKCQCTTRSCLMENKFLGQSKCSITWEAIYAGHKASCSALILSLPSKIESFSEFIQIKKLVELWKMCQGANNPSFSVLKNTVYNVCGEKIGIMKEVVELDQHGNEKCFHNWRSLSCSYFMETTASSSSLCHSCNILRRNLSVQLVRFNSNLHEEHKKLVEPSMSKTNKGGLL